MKIETRKFGEIDIEKEKIIHMPSGLPGFPGKHRFTLIERKETKPFCWYQSVEDPDLAVEPHSPPEPVIQDVKQILSASQADLGSVEYLINEDDGRVYYYDINPLSNFVADAPNVIGFDPTVNLVDFVQERAGL